MFTTVFLLNALILNGKKIRNQFTHGFMWQIKYVMFPKGVTKKIRRIVTKLI